MPTALTNTAWGKICAAAGRTPKAEAEARATLSAVLLHEYPNFAYHRERVIGDRERGERMVEHLDAFAELYRQRWLPRLPVDDLQVILEGRACPFGVDDRIKAHLWWIRRLRLLALSQGDAAWSKQRANAKNRLLTHLYCAKLSLT